MPFIVFPSAMIVCQFFSILFIGQKKDRIVPLVVSMIFAALAVVGWLLPALVDGLSLF